MMATYTYSCCIIISLTTIDHLLIVLFRPWAMFLLLLRGSTGNLSQSVFKVTTPTQWQVFNGQVFPTSECSSWRKLPTVPEMMPLQWVEKWLLHSFVLIRREVVQPVLTKAITQPAKAAAMCMACLECARPPLPYPPFLQAQNLSSNRLWQLIRVAKVRRCQMMSSVVKGLCYGICIIKCTYSIKCAVICGFSCIDSKATLCTKYCIKVNWYMQLQNLWNGHNLYKYLTGYAVFSGNVCIDIIGMSCCTYL